ncbi:MAG TPA: sigma-70 family RNA polymerase sigma factor [Euryarchaeota archaeon]|nr:sigma-70 family RNA polymerase sigma factor [Euryarchaeota archaeon]
MKKDFQINDIEALRGLLYSCMEGDSETIMHFQEIFGEDIYNFPVKVRGSEIDKAADFYCYCFEKSRIFKRLFTYKGICKLRTYQYHILNNLYTEWKRTEKLHTIPAESLNAPITPDSKAEMVNFLEDYDFSYTTLLDGESISLNTFDNIINQLYDEEKIYIKLLSYHEFGLDITDLRVIARISGNPLNEVMDFLNEIDKRLSEKNEDYAARLAKLDEIEVKILNIEKQLRSLRQQEHEKNENHNNEINELERKLQWRHTQKNKLLILYKRANISLSYRDIAALLSVSVGTVSAKINNAKKRFLRLYEGESNEERKL